MCHLDRGFRGVEDARVLLPYLWRHLAIQSQVLLVLGPPQLLQSTDAVATHKNDGRRLDHVCAKWIDDVDG